MEQRRKKKHSKHPSNYCRNCKTKVRKYRITCPFCGKFIVTQLPLLLLAGAIFSVLVYSILVLISWIPPLEIPSSR